MNIGIIGDLHGLPIPNVLTRQIQISEPDFLLQVGDIWTACTVKFPCPMYFIWGNHEREDIVNCTNLPNVVLSAGLHDINGIKIAALPSIPTPGFAPGPALFYDEDYQKCWDIDEHVDIFMSHGCGFPFIIPLGGVMRNVEDPKLTLLIQKIKPTYAISGHNHVFKKEVIDGIQLIRLGVSKNQVYDVLFFD